MIIGLWQRLVGRRGSIHSDEKLRHAESELHRRAVAMWQTNGIDVTTPKTQTVEGLHTVTWETNNANDCYPVVCMHGYGTGSGIYATSLPLLGKYGLCRVHAIDTPGCGLSVREEKWSRIKTQERAEEAVVSKLEQWRLKYEYEKIVLVGHSIGAILATAYAEKYPERCAGLILASPAGVGAKEKNATTNSSRFSLSRELLAAIWRNNLINPYSVLRTFPEWGKRNLSAYVERRFRGYTMQNLKTAFRDYLYENIISGHVSLGGSLVTLLLEPLRPQIGLRPLEDRLSDPHFLRSDTILAFIYGDRDWMDNAPAFRVQRQREVQGKQTPIACVSDANHNLMLDNPLGFSNALLATLPSKCFLSQHRIYNSDDASSSFFFASHDDNLQKETPR